MSISTIFPRLTVKPMTENGCPPGSHETIPAAPFTSTGRANSTSREKVSACSATARAPRSSLDAPGGTPPRSARTTTFGSRTAKSASKSPPRGNLAKCLHDKLDKKLLLPRETGPAHPASGGAHQHLPFLHGYCPFSRDQGHNE